MASEIPEGWKRQSYKKTSHINRDSLSTNHPPERQIEYIDISSIPTTGKLGETRQMTFEDAPSRARRRVHSGDTLVSTVRPYLRSFVYIPDAHEDLVASTGFAVLSPREGVDPHFLYQTVLSTSFMHHLEARMTGSNYPAVKVKDVKSARLLVPPFPEQKKIAAILASVDEAIEATEAVIEQTRRVKKGLLQELLTRGIGHTEFEKTAIGEIPKGWEVKPLKSLAEHITSGPRGWAEYYVESGFLFLRSQNIRGGFMEFEECVFVDPPNDADAERCVVMGGDVLLTITGNNTGNAAQVPDSILKAFVSQHICLIRLENRALHSYLARYIEPGAPGSAQLLDEQYGQSKPGLNLRSIREMLVALPPDDERRQIDKAFEAVDRTRTENDARLEQLRAVKRGLLQDLLTGKVRVKGDAAVEDVREAAEALAE